MYGIDISGWGGLAGTAADTASSLAPAFDFSNVIAPTLDPAALTGVAGTLAEEGKDVATGLIPNLTAPVTGLAGSASGVAPWSQQALQATTPLTNSYYGAGWTPSTPGMFDGIKEVGTDTMKFFNDNSKGLEAGGKLVGGLAGMYSAMQNSKLAKEQINMMKDNTAYNRSRQATGDKNLADASARVFGVSTPYTDAALGVK